MGGGRGAEGAYAGALAVDARYDEDIAAAAPTAVAVVETPLAVLPDDVPGEARALVAAGQGLAALSLLYRGGVRALDRRFGLALGDSATERECLRAVDVLSDSALVKFFGRLTRAWQRAAYAGSTTVATELEQLCADWAEHFGAQA